MKTSTIVRKAFAAENGKDAGKTPEDEEHCMEKIKLQSLDVYRPKATNIEEKLPVIIAASSGLEYGRDNRVFSIKD
ncbi:MAG: hypothetical protein V8S55_03175 [Mediterraneibacter faecis]